MQNAPQFGQNGQKQHKSSKSANHHKPAAPKTPKYAWVEGDEFGGRQVHTRTADGVRGYFDVKRNDFVPLPFEPVRDKLRKAGAFGASKLH